MNASDRGALEGLRVIELAGLGPAPFVAMLLSDMGAEVIRVSRPSAVALLPDAGGPSHRGMDRGRRSIVLDVRAEAGRELFLRLVDDADAVVEGFRPGVVDRLGIGPTACLARNPRLVYGQMTAFGQDGPWANRAAHDINAIALAGALEPIGREGQAPVPPLAFLGDFGGGAMSLAFGMVCALYDAARTGAGQVVDAAMVDGVALLSSFLHSVRTMQPWGPRGTNLVDSGAPFYEVYATADDRWVAVGAIEPRFYAELLDALGLADEELPAQMDQAAWPELKARFAAVFRTRTRDEWCQVMEARDACFAPVLTPDEAVTHPHNVHRGTFFRDGDVPYPAPAPRLGATPARPRPGATTDGEHTDEVLAALGCDAAEIERLRATGTVA